MENRDIVSAVKEFHKISQRKGLDDSKDCLPIDDIDTTYTFNGTEEELLALIKEVIFEDPETRAYAQQVNEAVGRWKEEIEIKENEFGEKQTLIEELERELDLLKIEYEAICKRRGKLQTSEEEHVPVASNSWQKTDTEDDDIEIIEEVKFKPNFPEIVAGVQCYAVKHNDLWKKAVVVDVFPKSSESGSEMYKVKIGNSTKTVSKQQIAFNEPPQRYVKLGCRIIALYREGNGKLDFYSGVVAEPPFKNNCYRYLVFFDDGCAQYTTQNDIRVIAHQHLYPWIGLPPDLSEFIQKYMQTYNERRILKMSIGQPVKCEREGKWLKARCLKVDCSLVKVYFENHKSGHASTEWIYRGSTRFEPLYILHNQLYGDGKFTPTTSTIFSISQQRNKVSTETQTQPEQMPTEATKQLPKPQRAFKSTSMKFTKTLSYKAPAAQVLLERANQLKLQPKKTYGQTRNEHAGNRIKVPYPRVPPTAYVPHECGDMCISIDDDPNSYKGKYAQTIPIYVGFERFICRTKRTKSHHTSNKKFVVYKGPCGRRIRNMKEMGEYLTITNSRLTIDLFSFEQVLHLFEPFVATNVLVSKADMSDGVEAIPISCVNAVSHALPDPLIYSNIRMPQKDVNLNTNTDFMVCCNCTDNCQDKSKCACQMLTYEGQKFLQPDLPVEKSGYIYRRLDENVITGVYECNSKCSCKKTCFNRVVQNSLSVRLQIFKTEKRGWGLRCLDDVPNGGFICIYAGQLLSEEGADQGGREYGDEYFAELDFIETCENVKEGYEDEVVDPNVSSEDDQHKSDSDWECESLSNEKSDAFISQKLLRSKRSKDSPSTNSGENRKPDKDEAKGSTHKSIRSYFEEDLPYVMDAKTSGNLGRYLNHSCDPNVFVQNVFVDTHDPRFPWIAFFANTFIRAGSELTWDYGYQPGIVEGKVMYCYCGSDNCRGRLL